MSKRKLILIIDFITAVIVLALIVLMFIVKGKKYTISFDTNGGSIVEKQFVKSGDKIKIPNPPAKDGYIFIGWTLNGINYNFDLKVESDLTLVATWSKNSENVKTYNVTFDTDGGSVTPNQVVYASGKVIKPNDPIREGFNFVGWTLNGDDYDFNSQVNNDIDLKAKWEKINKPVTPNVPPVVKKYTVTFNSNGGSSVKAQIVNEGAKVAIPSKPTRSGFTFMGWALNGKDFDFNSQIKNNITLIAKWEKVNEPNTPDVPPVIKKYTVTFNSNGGSSVKAQTINEGAKVSIPSNPTRNWFTFVGWTLNGENYDFNSQVKDNITLIAKWKQNSYTIKVSLVDQYSPDRILTVYENGTHINVAQIKYNGVTLCSGSNMVVNLYEIEGINSLTVVLLNGSTVTAIVQN